VTEPLLELLNRLLAGALAEAAPRGGFHVRSVALDADGARIVAELRPPAGEGELVLRLRVEPPAAARQALTLTVEQAPRRWAPAAEPFRRLLAGARLRLELDFTPPDDAP
jgi:hypothetical protein